MPFNHYRTKRPHEALLDLYIDKNKMIVEGRREPQGNDGTPPFVLFESNSLRRISKEDRVWLPVCLGQAPAKK
jgi:hypothetical protein